MDNLSKKDRSLNMSHIKGKNTSLEILVRKKLFADGFRYKINDSSLPGKPDIVLPKYHTVIFVNGCFWHRHNCKLATIPKTNTEYWINKFKKNEENDEKNYRLLRNYGWHVIVVWECEIKEDVDKLIKSIEKELKDYLLNDVLYE
ncbi:very short patch repair endonuclease [Faecalitalea cylindroides]|uniref:Very short patch repair endonuclease n=1 Tax=Faecalitalea cylindroides ATCC 27803 TaxID=649755 RepID=U2RA92_9FIRM|nr:very short patch repair endonuclease [Faecalitalea cylindroides]ERK47637.1 DNA mismatch endonuclease Vsr [[Eubacterium] cylindroides ATCC 27803] [Faecalitalea cylindroides ATCC 27803]